MWLLAIDWTSKPLQIFIHYNIVEPRSLVKIDGTRDWFLLV